MSEVKVSRELSDELAGLFSKGFLDDRMVSEIVRVVRKHNTPPELQADNAKLRERISTRLIDLTNMRNEHDELQATIAKLREGIADHWKVVCDQRAEIERLKGGQGEPAGYVHQREIDRIAKGQAHWATFWKSDGANNPSRHGSPAIPLYTSQPTPVSVAQYKIYITQPAESLAGMAARQLKDEKRWIEIRDANSLEFPDMCASDYYPVGSAILIPVAACLDKVKELNP